MVTVPGPHGTGVAFVTELFMTFTLMTVVLYVTNTPPIARYAGLCAGLLVATYITALAPFSGMSMNPARTLASAVAGNNYVAIWVYFVAPVLGMLLAVQVYVLRNGRHAIACAKYHHQNTKRCIFCRYGMERTAAC